MTKSAYTPDSIRIALAAVERDIDNMDSYEPFSTIEKLGLEALPYNDVVEHGRDFPATVVANFLNILIHGYTIDAEALVGDARKWVIECNDEYLVEIALRQHLELSTFFFKRRLLRALAIAKERFPRLRELICRYEWWYGKEARELKRQQKREYKRATKFSVLLKEAKRDRQSERERET